MPAINLSNSYNQTFDSLFNTGTSNSWTDDQTISGWYANRTLYIAGTGSSNTGALYSFGGASSSDRALGSLASGGTGTIYYGARFVNNTSSIITTLDISYTGEQWRNGGSATTSPGIAQTLDFQYQIGAISLTSGTWVDFNSLDFTTPIFGTTTATALDGNIGANRGLVAAQLSGLNLAPGQEIWLRWQDLNDANNDHGVAIDDFSISAGSSGTPAGVTINQSGLSTINEQGQTTTNYTIALNTTPSGPVTIQVAADGQTQISRDGINFFASLTLDLSNTTPQSLAVRAIDDTQQEASPHSGVISHSITGSADPTYSNTLTPVNPVTVSILDNDLALPITRIHTIQGSGTTATAGTFTIEGIVVGDFQGTNQLGGFYLQEEDNDADSSNLTAEGIFVNSLVAVNVGDRVQITGTVQENSSSPSFGQAVITPGSSAGSLQILERGLQSLVTPTVVDLPTVALGDLERYEGMLVTFPETLTVTETFNLGRFGEVVLSANGRLFQPTNVVDPNDDPASGTNSSGSSNVAAVTAQQNLNDRSRIILDDGSNAANLSDVPYIDTTDANPLNDTLRLGSTITGLTGVLGFGFSEYRIQPTQAPSFDYAARPEVPTVGGNVKVASFNVLNYFNGDGQGGGFPTSRGADSLAEFNRQRAKIMAAIAALNADVVGLIEMENDGDGPNSAIADLVNGLNAVAGAGTYAFVSLANTTGSAGTDEIKVAFIYKPGAVTPVGNAIYFNDPAFDTARPPLAQTFRVNATGEVFTPIINHFKSKSSAANLPGDTDQGDGQGLSNATRKAQATALLNFVTQIQTLSGDSDVMVIGDLNAYNEEDPIDILRSGGLTKLITPTESYVFQGQTGSLDHALVTASLLAQVTGAAKWNINADEPITLDYNDDVLTTGEGTAEDRNDTTLYVPTPFRSSDHDPVLVGLNLVARNVAPIANIDTVTLVEDSSLTFNVLTNDSDANDDPLQVIDFTAVTNGTLSTNGNGSFTYTPNANFAGTDSFAYTISDGRGGTAATTVNITVMAVNDLPIARNDSAEVTEGATVTIPVLTNDSDPENQALTITNVTTPTSGTVVNNGDGTLTFTAGFNVSSSNFSYTISDGNGGTATGTVNLTINPLNLNGTNQGNNLIGTELNNHINGNGGDDLIEGRGGNDTINGGAGRYDVLLGQGGDDTITDTDGVLSAAGGAGNDTLHITFRADWHSNPNGNGAPRSENRISGGVGDDTITVTMRDSRFILSLLADEATSSAADGNDQVTLRGEYARSTITLGGGNDTFTGGVGADTVLAGAGDDTLNGGAGRNTLTGGSGRDRFILSATTGTDTITDFTLGQDKIVLSGIAFNQIRIIQGTGANANHTLIRFNNGTGFRTIAILQNVQASLFTLDDFSLL